MAKIEYTAKLDCGKRYDFLGDDRDYMYVETLTQLAPANFVKPYHTWKLESGQSLYGYVIVKSKMSQVRTKKMSTDTVEKAVEAAVEQVVTESAEVKVVKAPREGSKIAQAVEIYTSNSDLSRKEIIAIIEDTMGVTLSQAKNLYNNAKRKINA